MGCLKLTYNPVLSVVKNRCESELTFKKSVLDLRRGYIYGFNGMEADDEVKGKGNSYTTPYRQLDPRLGRWLSLDPLMAKYAGYSPYSAFNNNPIVFKDPTGLEGEGDYFDVKTGEYLGTDGVDDGKEYLINKTDFDGITSDQTFSGLSNEQKKDWLSKIAFSPVTNHQYSSLIECIGNEAKSSVNNTKNDLLNLGEPDINSPTEEKATIDPPKYVFEAGETYAIRIEAIEIVNIAGASWGWWRAKYNGERAESDAGGAFGVSGEAGAFTQLQVKKVTFHKTVTGNTLAEALNKTFKINCGAGGAMVFYTKMKGLTRNSELIWEGTGDGAGMSVGFGGSASCVEFKDIK